MNYPDNLKLGDTIGICAPSDGISEDKIEKYEKAIEKLRNIGYKVIETVSVRKSTEGRSADAKQRADEFMTLYENPDVKLIIFATGGDYIFETFDYLDFNKLRHLPPKWMQGYSDITGYEFLFNTLLEIPSIYCQTIKDYAMEPLFRNLTDALKIASGEEIVQHSFELCEKGWQDIENPNYQYNLTEKVEWKSLNNEEKIEIEGRILGGCLDNIITYVGTKYDNVKEYINKMPEGIIWFFDIFAMSTPTMYRSLWQLKEAGYFDNCKGIIIGRPLFVREEYAIPYAESFKDALSDLNVPVIYDVDVGHVSPQLAIVNGGYAKITYENGKGKIKNYFK